jgi:hypothetical protein
MSRDNRVSGCLLERASEESGSREPGLRGCVPNKHFKATMQILKHKVAIKEYFGVFVV